MISQQIGSESGTAYTVTTEGMFCRDGKQVGWIDRRTAVLLVRRMRRALASGEQVLVNDLTEGAWLAR